MGAVAGTVLIGAVWNHTVELSIQAPRSKKKALMVIKEVKYYF